MSSETKKNDDLNQRVTERIQDQLIMVMPEEDIRQRVDAVVDSFFSATEDRYGKRAPSVFSEIVSEHIREKVKKIADSIFDSPDWKVDLDDKMQLKMGKALQTILGIAPNALADTVATEVAKARAGHLAMLITNNLRHSGAMPHDTVYKIEQAVHQSLTQMNGPR